MKTPEARECPKCKAELAIDSLLGRMKKEYQPRTTCKCGALLFLDWERDETDDGPNDMYWLEEVRQD
jgi:hypothetical protein